MGDKKRNIPTRAHIYVKLAVATYLVVLPDCVN